MMEQCYSRCHSDHCVYFKRLDNGRYIILLLYVMSLHDPNPKIQSLVKGDYESNILGQEFDCLTQRVKLDTTKQQGNRSSNGKIIIFVKSRNWKRKINSDSLDDPIYWVSTCEIPVIPQCHYVQRGGKILFPLLLQNESIGLVADIIWQITGAYPIIQESTYGKTII